MPENPHRLETHRQRRTQERQQRQVVAAALNKAAKELRALEELCSDSGGTDRAS